MKNMTLEYIAEACQGRLFGTLLSGKSVQGVVIDSRLVEEDFLFIAVPGERVDGHDYIDRAFAKGAMAIICEKIPECPAGPYILVKNSLQALKDIAKWYRRQLDITVVGITGSVGKTSTKEFISSVLSQKYSVLKTEGNFNNEIGLPLTILRIRSSHQIAVLEMGISDFGEMHRLSEIARPDIAVITNIGPCHLENLGSREGVLKAKSEIFDYLSKNGSVVLNGNDDMLSKITTVKGRSPYRFGMLKRSLGDTNTDQPEGGSDSLTDSTLSVTASHVVSRGLLGSSCLIHMGDQAMQTDIPLPGDHMILNALAAASVGLLLNLTKEEISSGIAGVQPVDGRSNIISRNNITIIDDCYNANPVSMKTAIDMLCTANTPLKYAILGDMFELGENQEALHREVGSYAASKGLDLLICVGSLSSHMYDGASQILDQKQHASKSVYSAVDPDTSPATKLLYFSTRDDLLSALPKLVSDHATLLVKASHGMGFHQVVKSLVELSGQ